MKLVPINQIRKEDIPGAPEWIDRVIGPLNQFMENVYKSLAGNLTLVENIAGIVKQIYVDTNDLPYELKNPLKTTPKVVIVGAMRRDIGYHEDETSAVWPDWEFTKDGIIKIHNISGLDTNKHFINLLIL